MSELRVTDGDWYKDPHSMTVRSASGTIARCPVPQDGGTFECAQNAALLAASKKLYAALERSMRVLADRAAGGRAMVSSAEALIVLNDAKAALGLARGEQS